MYVICNTSQDDVLNAVKAMVKQGFVHPIHQHGAKVYNRLDASRNHTDITDANEKKRKVTEATINLKTQTIHKRNCSRRGKDANVVHAKLNNLKKTGLKLCGSCMT